MNPFFQHIIAKTVKNYYQENPEKKPKDFKLKRKVSDIYVEFIHVIKDMIQISIGVLSATFGLKGFLIPNSFIDGGVTGISLIVQAVTGFSLPLLIVILNLPFVLLAYTAISQRFALKSVIGIVLLSISVYLIPFPVVTDQPILVATFGGIFLGIGIGMAIRGGAIIDGTEVLAIFISRKTILSVGNVILIFNVIIFLTGAYIFSVEIALYAILTYFAASWMVDFIIDGIEEFMAVTIISDLNDEIRNAIVFNMGRGCTIITGQKGYAKTGDMLKPTNIVYTVITRLELSRLKTEIDKIDPEAFMVMTSVKDTKGGMIKKNAIKKISSGH